MGPKLKRFLRSAGISAAIIYVFLLLLDNVIMPHYVQQGKTTKVPDVVGKTIEEARTDMKAAGLEPKETERKQDRHYPEGTVILQNPAEGAEVKFGRGIYLTVSGGEQMLSVPNLRGKSVRDATFDLERYNLKLGTVQYETSEEFFENTIIRQEPAAASKVSSSTSVNIVVSQGRSADKSAVPGVTLKTYTEAEKILTQAGFKVGVVTYQISLDLLPNTIIEQYPHTGELAVKGQTIDLIVAQKSEKLPMKEN
jgi:eukaryotic-like serine/threonine-protein kinase